MLRPHRQHRVERRKAERRRRCLTAKSRRRITTCLQYRSPRSSRGAFSFGDAVQAAPANPAIDRLTWRPIHSVLLVWVCPSMKSHSEDQMPIGGMRSRSWRVRRVSSRRAPNRSQAGHRRFDGRPEDIAQHACRLFRSCRSAASTDRGRGRLRGAGRLLCRPVGTCGLSCCACARQRIASMAPPAPRRLTKEPRQHRSTPQRTWLRRRSGSSPSVQAWARHQETERVAPAASRWWRSHGPRWGGWL